LATGLWSVRRRLVGFRAYRSFDRRAVRRLRKLARRLLRDNGGRRPACCYWVVYSASRCGEQRRDRTQGAGPPSGFDMYRDRSAVAGERLDGPRDQERIYCGGNRNIRSDVADRSWGDPCAPAERCLLPAICDWCSAMDGLVAINRLQSACDIRAAVPAAIARTQSTDRWIHGCGSIAGMDGRHAFRRVAYR